MAANTKHGLGRGLEALLGSEDLNVALENIVIGDESAVKLVSIYDIKAGNFQPRKDFKTEALQALAESIKEKGVLQPILVRKNDSLYEIIAGERRFRAAQIAGLKEIPVIEKNLADNEILEVALIENVVREDLTILEEAAGLNQLMSTFNYTQDKIAKVVHKSRSYIANTLRLLSLPESVKLLINEEKLSAGHARTLIGLNNAEEVALRIVQKGLNVRQAEDYVSQIKNAEKKEKIHPKKIMGIKDAELSAIETNLSQKFGLKVQINASQKGKGKIIFAYNDFSELEDIIEKLEK